MSRRLSVVLLVLLLASVVLAAVPLTAAAGPRISHVWCFGDSYTDNGASFRISTRIMKGAEPPADGFVLAAPPAYPDGRWTNGPTMVEVLAKRLGVRLTDFAVGGAFSSYSNYYTWLDPYRNRGLLGQVSTFRQRLRGAEADPKALYVVQIAGNDYFYYMDYGLTMPGTVDAVARQVVANECEAVRQLALVGARRFLVIGSENVALLPWEVGAGRTNTALEYTKAVNGRLPGAIKGLARQLRVEIDYFGLAAAGGHLRESGPAYGLTELDKPFELTYPTYVAGVGDPDTYFFWDEWHPTARVHEIIGRMMFRGLPADWR